MKNDIEPMKNIAFIGLPGCGKTTVSKKVAAALGQAWYDSDLEIEVQSGMSIPQIFAEKGEEYFRRLESRCIAGLMAKGPAVIALGGGAILHNGSLIKENAVVIYLSRRVESIMATLPRDSRPLLAGKAPSETLAALQALYEQRWQLYEDLYDFKVDNEGSVEEAVKKVLAVLKI